MSAACVQVANSSSISDLKLNLHHSVVYRWYNMQEEAKINVF